MMNLSQLWNLSCSAVKAWQEDRGPSRGAAIAFYALFSISPVLIIVTAVAGYFLGQEAVQSSIVEQVRAMAGTSAADVVASILHFKHYRVPGFVAGLISLTTMLVGATSVFVELKDALDQIWKVRPGTSGRLLAFIRPRLLSFGVMLAMTLLVMISILFSATTTAITKLNWAPLSAHGMILEVLNFLFLFAMTTAIFAVIYKVLPGTDIAWTDVRVGAIITAILFTAGKTLIRYYLFSSAGASVFGAAASLILMLLWVYYSVQIFLLGAEFTYLYAHNLGSRCLAPG